MGAQHDLALQLCHAIEPPSKINRDVEYFFNRFGAAELAQLVQLVIEPADDKRQRLSLAI